VRLNAWVVNIIKAMYYEASTAVKLKNGTSQELGVKVGSYSFAIQHYVRSIVTEIQATFATGTSACAYKGLRVNLE
jgi:hypothetical protein